MEEDGKILIVDDEETFLYSTADLLRKQGYECDCAYNSLEALTSLEKKTYDVLIADLNMPGNKEMDFIRNIQKNYSTIPVIVVTGYPSLPTAIESLHLSVFDYLIKPLDISQLFKNIELALERRRFWRTMQNFQGEIEAWTNTMNDFKKQADFSGCQGGQAGKKLTLENYLHMAQYYITHTLTSLFNTIEILKTDKKEAEVDVCAFLNCPRLSAYKDGIREAVEILLRTKSAFKSKQLGELRKKLEALLAENVN